MKLSDEKLINLLEPLIFQETQAYGLIKLKIEGKLDQGGDEAIYIDVWLKNNNFSQKELYSSIHQLIDKALEDKDQRTYHYLTLHHPFNGEMPNFELFVKRSDNSVNINGISHD